MTRFRIRSIYDIPIASLITEEAKFELVQPTKDQAAAFKLEQNQIAPDLEISDVEEGLGFKIEGKEAQVLAVEDAMRSAFDDLIIRRHSVSLHSVYLGRVKHVNRQKNLAILELSDKDDAIMFSGDLRRGETVLVQIKELNVTQGQLPRCSDVIHLAGRYAILERDASFVRVSRSLAKADRDSLYKLGQSLKPEGHGLIMRTSAVTSPKEEIIEEIKELATMSDELHREARDAYGPSRIIGGTSVSHIFLPGHCKPELTRRRNTIVKTLPSYHFFKSYSADLVISVEFATSLMDKMDADSLADQLKQVLINRDFYDNQHVRIHSYTLDGEVEDTSFGQLTWEGDTMVLHRSFRAPAEGPVAGFTRLNTGDYALTHVKEGAWNLHTRFFSEDGTLKGELFNIVTPVEMHQNQRL